MYKPYSPEWHRKRYLKEAIDKYLDKKYDKKYNDQRVEKKLSWDLQVSPRGVGVVMRF